MDDRSLRGTDNFVRLGWGPLPTADVETAITALMAEGGWRREDSAEGIYVTAADSDMLPMTDMEGYGTTYLFADGQVKLAGTKAGLVIIAAPEGFTP